jgi:hypothetical protein
VPVDSIGMDPYGIPLEQLIELTGCHPDTARRWKRQRRVPRPWDVIIALRLSCDLGALAADWRGWKLQGAELVSPDGVAVRVAQVLAIPILLQLVSALERERATPRQLELMVDR